METVKQRTSGKPIAKSEQRRSNLIRFQKGFSTDAQSKDGSNTGMRTVSPKYAFADLVALYEKNSTAQKCISFFAENVIKGGYLIKKEEWSKATDAQMQEVENFFTNCAGDETIAEIVEKAVIDYRTAGNLALEIARNATTGKPSRMYHCPIKNIEKLKGTADFRTGERFLYKDGTYEAEMNKYTALKAERGLSSFADGKNEIIFMSMPNPDDRHYGLSPAVSLQQDLLLTKYGKDYNISQFEQSLMARFAILVQNGGLTEGSDMAIRDFVSDAISNQQWNSIPVLETDGENAKIEIVKLQEMIKDGSFLDMLKFLREEVYVAYGVPPILLSITENSTLANQMAQLKKFYDDEIAPFQNKLKHRFNRMIKEDFEVEGVVFEFINPDFRDIEALGKIASDGVKDGTFSINEKREMLGKDKLEIEAANGHFIYHNSLGVIPLEELSKITGGAVGEAIGKSQGQVVIDALLGLRNSLAKSARQDAIDKGTEEFTY